jgi:hypothetical protein
MRVIMTINKTGTKRFAKKDQTKRRKLNKMKMITRKEPTKMVSTLL